MAGFLSKYIYIYIYIKKNLLIHEGSAVLMGGRAR